MCAKGDSTWKYMLRAIEPGIRRIKTTHSCALRPTSLLWLSLSLLHEMHICSNSFVDYTCLSDLKFVLCGSLWSVCVFINGHKDFWHTHTHTYAPNWNRADPNRHTYHIAQWDCVSGYQCIFRFSVYDNFIYTSTESPKKNKLIGSNDYTHKIERRRKKWSRMKKNSRSSSSRARFAKQMQKSTNKRRKKSHRLMNERDNCLAAAAAAAAEEFCLFQRSTVSVRKGARERARKRERATESHHLRFGFYALCVRSSTFEIKSLVHSIYKCIV